MLILPACHDRIKANRVKARMDKRTEESGIKFFYEEETVFNC